MNPYANSRVYGPYVRKDKRMHVICIFPDGSRKTVSYPKYLLESCLGRILETNETVHHIDSDVTNNCLSNLFILDRTTHIQMHARRLIRQDFICPVCLTEFSLDSKQLSDIIANRKSGKSKTGPYCGKSCAGVGSDIRSEIREEYYTLLSLQSENSEVNAANSVKSIINDNAEQD